MTLSPKDKQTLNAIPLTDVMAAWGHTAHAVSKVGTWAAYLCPWHDDHHPSLLIDIVPRGTNPDCGFLCRACKESGFGAIQLAARLMGKPAGELSAADYMDVVAELAERCGVELEGEASHAIHASTPSWKQFREDNPQYADWNGETVLYEEQPWTLEALKALGFRVSLAQRRARKEDIADDAAEIKTGDLLTRFDPDTGEALYRCSLSGDYYRNPLKAEARTIEAWGRELTERFSVVPVSRFIMRHEPAGGGSHPIIVQSTNAYPVFVFKYNFGIKKYEPRSREARYKWTWWDKSDDADLDHRYFADIDLENVLEGAAPQGDKQHPYVETQKNKDGGPTCIRFKRVVLCSGPRDAMQVYAHSDAHVVWLLSETAGFDKKGGTMRPGRWLRALLKRLKDVTVEGGLYVCYDEDAVGLQCSQAIALADPQIHWLRLPKELGMLAPFPSPVKEGAAKPMKDVTDFVTHFQQVQALMPADVQHDDPVEWFASAMSSAPTCQFWMWMSERKDADGNGRARYKFDLRNVPVFLRARGMVRHLVQQGKASFSRYFLLGNNKTFTECFVGEKGSSNRLILQARELMFEWLMSHQQYNDGSLAGAIRDAKLDQATLEYIEDVDIDTCSYGEDFDHFFFENCAVRVDAESIKEVAYTSMKWWTNQEAILSGRFTLIPQPWRIIENPQYAVELKRHNEALAALHTTEERAQENMRWDSWASLWRYKLIMDLPLEEMPMHFRFIYNTCRLFWEKEEMGVTLTESEKQMQDMYFITAAHAIGSALVRYRTSSRQQWVYITDNGTRREDLASGGTGKTAILDMLSLLRVVLRIDGKSLEGGNITLQQETDKVVPGLHTIIALDETPAGFTLNKLYNHTLSLTSRGLYRESVVLQGSDLPKWVVASNAQPDISADSTQRRTYEVHTGDFYHPASLDGARPAHTPADDFKETFKVKEVARNLPPHLLNELRNLFIAFTQFFLQWPDETIRPPKDARAMLRLAMASSKDKQFTQWANAYIGDRRHRGIPISQRELAISLLDFCGIVVGEKTVKAAQKRIREQLPEYLRVSPYVANPEKVVLVTKSDKQDRLRHCAAWEYPRDEDGYSIPLDKHGNRPPRELIQTRCYYFYPKNRIPKYPYDPKHVGDAAYVQPAPATDPDVMGD